MHLYLSTYRDLEFYFMTEDRFMLFCEEEVLFSSNICFSLHTHDTGYTCALLIKPHTRKMYLGVKVSLFLTFALDGGE
jgi:hypothetical protein